MIQNSKYLVVKTRFAYDTKDKMIQRNEAFKHRNVTKRYIYII